MIAIAEKYSVEAVLKATGASQFAKAFRDASKSVQGIDKSTSGASVSIGKMLTAVAGVAAAVGVFRTLRGAVDGAISRFDTLSNFPRVLQLMGFEADESERAIQRLSDGIDGLPTTLDSVAGTAQRIAVMTGDLDGAVETTLALNNAFLASGASAQDAQRGLDQYVQMLSKGEVDLQSWRTLQETMPYALRETAEAFGYTGASAQNDLYEALKEGEITFDEFNAQLIELSEETGGFADMAKTSSTGIRTSWTNIQTAVVKGVADMLSSIDEALAGFGGISGVLDSVKVGIQTVFGFINANVPVAIEYIRTVYEHLKQWAPVIIGIATTFLTFYTVVGVINSVKTAVSSLRTGMMLLYTTMAANPVALVIAILAGLAAMFIYLWNTSDTFREGVTNAFNTLKEFVMPIVQTVVDFVMQVWGMLVEWWNDNSEQILATAQNVWETIVSVVSTVVGEVVDFVMEIWGNLVTWWREHGQMILEAASNVWNTIWTVITTVASQIWAAIQNMASIVMSIMEFLWPFIETLVVDTWNAIKGAIQGAIDVITGIIQFFSALFTGDWGALWDSIKQIVSGAVQFVWNFIQLWFVGKILKAGKALFTGLRSIVSTLWNTVKSLFTNGVNVAKNVVSTGFNFIRNIISTVMNAVRNVISSVWNVIKSVITSVLNGIKGVVTSVWNGIRNTISNVVNAIRNTIRNIFNSLRGIVSNAFNGVKNAVRNGIRGALNIIKNMFSSFKNAGKNIVTSIADGIKGAISKVTDAISNVTSKIRDFLPFSPAKEGPLEDIHKLNFAGPIIQSIRRGSGRVQAELADMLAIPQFDIAGQVGSVHAQVQRTIRYELQNNTTAEKQPAQITLVLGNREYEAFVEDINEVNAVNANLKLI